MYKLYTFLILIMFLIGCNKNPISNSIGDKQANKLINESSPYLLQHAYNPVDWHPWGDVALEKAKAEDKLIIISVGYAACHWCHVMEHESFEDSTVAAIMNEHFVPIKVDREERPDVDDVYMTAAHLINKSGGWPLNAIAMPDGKPIYAGTYFPKDQWIEILSHFIKSKAEDPQKLREQADQLTEGIVSTNAITVNTNPLKYDMPKMDDLIDKCLKRYDSKHGGRLGAPKFPMPNAYEFLMKYHWITGDKEALETTLLSLDKMAKGGIYDQLGGGFARYSTDETWLVPHFEKMLYDNGQLLSVYAQAYQLQPSNLYRDVIEETIEFTEREMSNGEGGFYSSLDADSEGEEGKFYIWSMSEIDSVLNNEAHSKIFNAYYDVSKRGNWEHKVILNKVKDLANVAKKSGITKAEAQEIINSSKAKLMKARDKKVRPGTDDKVLTSWNALMLAGYIDAYNALGKPEYLDKAIASAQFIKTHQLSKDGRLNRNYKDGKSSINAFLDDYALTINAFVKLYQATFDPEWLNTSQQLADYCFTNFYNDETKMFDYTSKLDPPLVAKKAEYNDNVIPASNSAMARSLFGLGTLTYNKKYLDTSKQMLNNMLDNITQSDYLSFTSNWMQLLLDQVKTPFEIAIVGDDALKIRNEMASKYLGNSILLGSKKEENLDLLKSKYVEDATMVYVCQNKVCKIPVENAVDALALAKH